MEWVVLREAFREEMTGAIGAPEQSERIVNSVVQIRNIPWVRPYVRLDGFMGFAQTDFHNLLIARYTRLVEDPFDHHLSDWLVVGTLSKRVAALPQYHVNWWDGYTSRSWGAGEKVLFYVDPVFAWGREHWIMWLLIIGTVSAIGYLAGHWIL